MSEAVVGVVDDHPIVSYPLADALRRAGHTVLEPVTAVESLPEGGPGSVAVCDCSLPEGRSGAEAVAYLASRGWRVVATSGVAGRTQVLDVVAAGAWGYVEKRFTTHAEYVHAVGLVGAGRHHVSPLLAALLLDDATARPLGAGDLSVLQRTALRALAEGDGPEEVLAVTGAGEAGLEAALAGAFALTARRRRVNRLSPRELDVVAVVGCRGLGLKETARELGIRPGTVADHLEAIKRKYLASHPGERDLSPRAAALRWAMELRLC
ncbi:response regulator transcription factor [Streptosporangium saharense]|uniref:response regulator transcription factor n=1 Tax=Streptosporangium saharense TaxID=1706840 RepID=UPI00343545EE